MKRPKTINTNPPDTPSTSTRTSPEDDAVRIDRSRTIGRAVIDIEQAPDTLVPTVSPDVAPRQTVVITGMPGRTFSPVLDSRGGVETLVIIEPELAVKLTAADTTSGLRYDKQKRSYVDVAEAGTVLVRKNADGDYQATSSRELTPSGPVLDPIEGMMLWVRRRQAPPPLEEGSRADISQPPADESLAPGPSKRPRLEETNDPPNTREGTARMTGHSQPDPNPWESWGEVTKPVHGSSIQIGHLHYKTMPITAVYNYKQRVPVYIQHPEFAPSIFATFERMLYEQPGKQPIKATPIGDDTWQVEGDTRLFEKPLSHSVAETFKDFTDYTSWGVAKNLLEGHMFTQPFSKTKRTYQPIYNTQISEAVQTLRYWKGDATVSAPRRENPLDMLLVSFHRDKNLERNTVDIQHPLNMDGLYRLDFDSRRFPLEWSHYKADPSDFNLRRLFGALLLRNGYEVFPLTQVHTDPVLVFKRLNHDKVYAVNLRVVIGDHYESGKPPALTNKALGARVGHLAQDAMITADTHHNLIWLTGGIQKIDAQEYFFIIREH